MRARVTTVRRAARRAGRARRRPGSACRPSPSPGPRSTTSTCATPAAPSTVPTRRSAGDEMTTAPQRPNPYGARPAAALGRTFLAHSAYSPGGRCAPCSGSRRTCVHAGPADDLAAAVRPAVPERRPTPGFGDGSYLEYLTPGVVVMTAMFSAGWAGTVVHPGHGARRDGPRRSPRRSAAGADRRDAGLPGADHDHPVAHRVRRRARGRRAFAGGVAGVLVVLVCAVLLAVVFAALSDAVALLVHQQEALIAMSQFLVCRCRSCPR